MEKILANLVLLIRAGYSITFEADPDLIGEAWIVLSPPVQEFSESFDFLIKFDLLCPEVSLAELSEFVADRLSSGGENG